MTRFLKHFLAACAFGLLGLPLLTWVVDPLGGFHDLRVPGFNANKPAAVSPKRETKALWMRKFQPDSVLLGSSRVLLGLSPAHPAFKGHSTFNFAITGAELAEIEAQLRYSQGIRPLKLAIIGLDFYAFNGFDTSTDTDFPFLELPFWGQAAKVMWSLESLEFTGKTLARQNVQPTRWLESNGLMRADIEALNLSTRKNVLSSLTSQYPVKLCGFRLKESRPLAHFEQILSYAHQHSIALVLFIPPVHAWVTEALYAQGLGETYAQWKLALAKSNEAVAQQLGRKSFPLWDFSGYNSYTTEPLPSGKKNRMQYYYDGSHFLPVVGDRMLERMMAENAKDVPSNFGRLLTTNTLVQAEEENARERQLFLTSAHAIQEEADFREAIEKLNVRRQLHCRQLGSKL